MSRAFSTSATKFVKRWLGYDRNELPPPWKIAAETWTMPGGTAEQRLGELQSVEIKYASRQITTTITLALRCFDADGDV